MNDLKTFADAEAVLATTLPNYESRPEQQRLAKAIEDALASGKHLLAEAGCGTGKSMAALIPAILSGKRVVISTATKALQDQIGYKDLPFLKENLGVDFEYFVLKGRSNFLCQAQLFDVPNISGLGVVNSTIAEFKDDPDFFALREDFEVDFSDSDWSKLSVSGDQCPGKRDCPFGTTCFAEAAKVRARDAQVIVVNHALLFIDMKIREQSGGYADLLGEYDVVIIDECHEAESYATSALGARIAEGTFMSLVTQVRNFAREFGPEGSEIDDKAIDVSAAALDFWESVPTGRIRVKTIIEHQDVFVAVTNALTDLRESLDDLFTSVGSIRDRAVLAKYERLRKRTWNLEDNFIKITTQGENDLVRWISTSEMRNGDVRKMLESAPVNVGTYLRPMLFGKTQVIAMSATLSTQGNFAYIASRLGCDNYGSLDAGTPFDYATQARLYVPTHISEPSPRTREAWQVEAIEEMYDLITASEGRALLLFTSNADLNAAHQRLARRIPYTVLKQGEDTNRKLAQKFADDEHSVLFATRSFFTGVDFSGSTCSLVVMSKLPFPVPSEPITEARCEAIKAAGGNDFGEYTIPEMSLILKQGFGRLIRHRTDTGMVAILDPRLVTKGYGDKIVDSLPPAPLVTDAKGAMDFLASI